MDQPRGSPQSQVDSVAFTVLRDWSPQVTVTATGCPWAHIEFKLEDLYQIRTSKPGAI